MALYTAGTTVPTTTITNNQVIHTMNSTTGRSWNQYVIHGNLSTGGYPSCPTQMVYTSIGKIVSSGGPMWCEIDWWSHHRGMWHAAYSEHIQVQTVGSGDGIYVRWRASGSGVRTGIISNNSDQNNAASNVVRETASSSNHSGTPNTWNGFTLVPIATGTWVNSRIIMASIPHCGADKAFSCRVKWEGGPTGVYPENLQVNSTNSSVTSGDCPSVHNT